MVIKTVNIINFLFFYRFSKSIFSNNGALGYNLSVFWSIYIVKITLIQVCLLNIITYIGVR